MVTYAIGDIHGCWETLQRLLDRVGWQPEHDRLWLTGDLVNRGPGSLAVLRWAYQYQDRITVVLGNHDLHLLARAAGVANPKVDDRLEQVLAAPDRDELLAWLGSRPLLFVETGAPDRVLVHAGLWPGWDLTRAIAEASRVSEYLLGGAAKELLAAPAKKRWHAGLRGLKRVRAATTVLTKVRTVSDDGRLCARYAGPPEGAPAGCRPWFEQSLVAGRAEVIFGHWATLGFYRNRSQNSGGGGGSLLALDSGCVYGGVLTAVCLDSQRVWQEPLVAG